MCSNLLVRPEAATPAALKNRAAAAKRPEEPGASGRRCRSNYAMLLAINQNAPRENLAGGIRKNYQFKPSGSCTEPLWQGAQG